MHSCTRHQEKSVKKQDHLSGWLKLRVDAEALSCSPPISPARERCETAVLSADSHRFCARAHSLPLPSLADSKQSAEANSCRIQHGARRCFLLVRAGFRRTGTDKDGRLGCRLGPVLCPSGMEDQRECRREAESGSRCWSGSVWRAPGLVVAGAAGVHAPTLAGLPLVSVPPWLNQA